MPSTFPPSLAQRTTNAIENGAWYCFLIWTAVGCIVMPFEIGERTIRESVPFVGLREALIAILGVADAVWIIFAAIIVYFYSLRREGGVRARVWAIIIMTGSAVAEFVGAKTGFPFGDYTYTDNFGTRIFGVLPFTIPLAWLIIILAGRYLTLWIFPHWNRWQISLSTAVLATLTDLNLEFIAWKVRAYWIWYPPGSEHAMNPPAWPPIQNYISWFVLSFLLCVVLPAMRQYPERRVSEPMRPVMVLLLMNGLFIIVHLVRWQQMI